MNRILFFLLLSVVGVLLLLSMFFSSPTDANPVPQVSVTPTAFGYLPFVAKNWPLTPTPIPVPTLEPCPNGYLEYRGTTDQHRPVGLCVERDLSAVTRVSLNYSISCNQPDYGANTLWEVSSRDGWPIEDRAFRIEARFMFDLTGTFTADFNAVSGTWQGIEAKCSGFPGPCWEVCRGPVGQWSATRQP